MKSRTTSRSRTTQHSKRHSNSSRTMYNGTMVVPGTSHLLPRARVAPSPVENCRLHDVQVEQIDHHLCSSIALQKKKMWHATCNVRVHTTTCFRVLGSRREEPTTNSSSNIPCLAHIVLRTAAAAAAAAGSGSSNERMLCEPLHQHLTSVNSEDYRERRWMHCAGASP